MKLWEKIKQVEELLEELVLGQVIIVDFNQFPEGELKMRIYHKALEENAWINTTLDKPKEEEREHIINLIKLYLT